MDPRLEAFLARISQLESSGGLNTNHKTMETGIHKGSSAYGQYGLMPNTIREMAKRKGIQEISGLQDQDLKTVMQDFPTIEQNIVEALGQHVLDRAGKDDELKAAYAWNMGHNLKPEGITPEMMENHPYVQKYKNLLDSEPKQSNNFETLAKRKALQNLASR